jgi:hypothetical protein
MSKMIDYTEEENLRDATAMSGMFAALDELPVPLIGRVRAQAVGSGRALSVVVGEALEEFLARAHGEQPRR